MPFSPRGIEQSLVLPPRWPLILFTGTLYRQYHHRLVWSSLLTAINKNHSTSFLLLSNERYRKIICLKPQPILAYFSYGGGGVGYVFKHLILIGLLTFQIRLILHFWIFHFISFDIRPWFVTAGDIIIVGSILFQFPVKLNPVTAKLGSKIQQGILWMLMRSKVAYRGQRSTEIKPAKYS